MEAVIHTCLFQLDNEWVFEEQQREKKGHCNYICFFPLRPKIIVITAAVHVQPLVMCTLFMCLNFLIVPIQK